MNMKGIGPDGLASGWPSIQGEIDDIKALEFACALCAKVAGTKAAWGGVQADAERATVSLKALIETSKSFESSAIERQAFLETMLRKDGLAVVIYLEASQVRQALADQGHHALADDTETEAITDQFQEILAGAEGMPPGLASWATEVEEEVAGRLRRAHKEDAP